MGLREWGFACVTLRSRMEANGGETEIETEASMPPVHLTKGIEEIQKACGWRLDVRDIGRQCGLLLKKMKQPGYAFEVINSEDSMTLSLVLEALSQSHPPRLIEPALSYLHRLIAAGLVVGESGDKSERRMVDTVVGKICDCGASSAEPVQLAVLKALLTICTSETFIVKGEVLLQAFRMIFNLAVGSNYEAIRSCATASLQQLLSVWFRKAAASDFSSSQQHNPEGEGNDLDVANIANLAEKADINGLEKVLARRLSENLSQREGEAMQSVPATPSTKKKRESVHPLSGLEVDLFVLLRSLCRLGARTISSATSDNFIVEGKLLALGLIKHVLQFQAWESVSGRFIQRSRNLLCVMLIRNANCSIEAAAVKQIEILSKVILQPRILAAMKPEAGAFMPLFIIRHLEVFSPEPHLLRAACGALCLFCSKEQLLADLFVNYDCEMNATNVFDRIVKGFCYVIISKPTYDAATDSKMKILACKALYQTMTALHRWFSSHQEKNDPAGWDGSEGQDTAVVAQEPDSRGRDLLRLKNKKDSLSGGIDSFNCHPIKGMKSLIRSGVLEDSVEAQAHFLYNTKGLSKESKGEFLGHHEENQVSVMHKYADFFDFAGLDFDEAMRVYLDTFRLPGEAQQIDRIMEKFADRYCTCNQGTFSTADQAYTLAYAIIMLNTDMHNPLAEHLMSKEAFVGMVNQCPVEAEGEDHPTLPEDFLEAIFDRIASNEIKMTGGDAKGAELQNKDAMTSPLMKVLKKALPFQRVMGDSTASQALPSLDGIKDLIRKHQDSAEGVWNSAENSEIAILMCGTICKHAMDVFDSLDKVRVSMDSFKLIIQCIKEAIIVTGLTSQKEQCDKLVCKLSDLVGFGDANTFPLTLPDSMRVEAFKSLVDITLKHPNLVHGAWTHVFRCLSRAQYFALHGSEVEVMRKFDRIAYDMAYNKRSGMSQLLIFFEAEGLQLIDQLFSGSGNMTGQTIVMFVSAMCAVSREELEEPIFAGLELILLQRLVETVHHNLNRIRMVWSRLWAATSTHLIGAGCEDSVEIAMYSIDALRQIVFKLLEHQELSNFKFQEEALKPFAAIMRQCELNQVNVFAIQCILQVVSAHNARLQSGWRSILCCVKIALRNEAVEVVDAALHILKQSWSEPQIVASDHLFGELKGCFLELMAHGNHVEHQSKAIEIVKDGVAIILDGLSEKDEGLEVIQLLCNMGRTALDHGKSCYHVAYQALFGLLARPGLKYSNALWEEILENVCESSFGVTELPGKELEARAGYAEHIRTYFPLLCKLVGHHHIPLHVSVPRVLDAARRLVLGPATPEELRTFLISQLPAVASELLSRDEGAAEEWSALAGCAKAIALGIREAFEGAGGGDPGWDRAALVRAMQALQEALCGVCRSLGGELEGVQTSLLEVLEESVAWAKGASAGENGELLVSQEVSGGLLLIEMLSGSPGRQGHLLRVCSRILKHFGGEVSAALAPLVAAAVKALIDVDCSDDELAEIVTSVVPHMEDQLEVRQAISEFLTKRILPPLERKVAK